MVTVIIAQLRLTHSSNLLTRQLTSVVRQKSDNLNQQITLIPSYPHTLIASRDTSCRAPPVLKQVQRASCHPRDHLGTTSGPLDRNKYFVGQQ